MLAPGQSLLTIIRDILETRAPLRQEPMARLPAPGRWTLSMTRRSIQATGKTPRCHLSPCGSSAGPKRKCNTRRRDCARALDDACNEGASPRLRRVGLRGLSHRTHAAPRLPLQPTAAHDDASAEPHGAGHSPGKVQFSGSLYPSSLTHGRRRPRISRLHYPVKRGLSSS